MICKTCQKDLPEDSFHNSIGWASGKVPHCKACEKERKRKSYLKEREHRVAKAKEYYWGNREKSRANGIQRRYGLSWDDYLTLFNKQKGCCVICSSPLELFGSDKHLVAQVDHCHTTNKVRGLLCTKCNTGLGNFRDSPELLKNAARYLKEND